MTNLKSEMKEETYEYTDEQILAEFMTRVTDEFLEFVVTKGAMKWSEIERKWFEEHPNVSMFKSGYIPKTQ